MSFAYTWLPCSLRMVFMVRDVCRGMKKRGIVDFLGSDLKGSANDSAIKRPNPYIGLARPFLPDFGP